MIISTTRSKDILLLEKYFNIAETIFDSYPAIIKLLLPCVFAHIIQTEKGEDVAEYRDLLLGYNIVECSLVFERQMFSGREFSVEMILLISIPDMRDLLIELGIYDRLIASIGNPLEVLKIKIYDTLFSLIPDNRLVENLKQIYNSQDMEASCEWNELALNLFCVILPSLERDTLRLCLNYYDPCEEICSLLDNCYYESLAERIFEIISIEAIKKNAIDILNQNISNAYDYGINIISMARRFYFLFCQLGKPVLDFDHQDARVISLLSLSYDDHLSISSGNDNKSDDILLSMFNQLPSRCDEYREIILAEGQREFFKFVSDYVSIFPDNRNILVKVIVELSRGRFGEALKILSQNRFLDDSDNSVRSMVIVDCCLCVGKTCSSTEERNEAYELLHRDSGRNELDALWGDHRAYEYIKYLAAMKRIDFAAYQDDFHPDLDIVLGEIFWEKGNYTTSYNYFSRALKSRRYGFLLYYIARAYDMGHVIGASPEESIPFYIVPDRKRPIF